MRVAIVNDLSLAREVLRRAVLSVSGYSVAWEAADGDEAVSKATADRPDVLLMDLVMPKVNGVDATRAIMRQSPCPVVVVTSTIPGNYDLVMQAMGAGALDAVETPTFAAGGLVQRAEPLLARLGKIDVAPWRYVRHAEWQTDRPETLKLHRLDGDIYLDVPKDVRAEVEAFVRWKTQFIDDLPPRPRFEEPGAKK